MFEIQGKHVDDIIDLKGYISYARCFMCFSDLIGRLSHGIINERKIRVYVFNNI
jgi:hypothetical protein